mgnify:CR=1 FL=1
MYTFHYVGAKFPSMVSGFIADPCLKAPGSDKYEVISGGLEAHGLNPLAVQVINEADVDIGVVPAKLTPPAE